jgi:hypothetical protein
MRTTITIDPDVEQLILDTMQKSRKSFKEIINQSLRKALSPGYAKKEPTFKVEARNLDLRVGIDAGSYNKLADDMEIDAFLEAAEQKKDYS